MSEYEELLGGLEMFRGDTEHFQFELVDDETEEAVDLSAALIRFTVKDAIDGTQIFQRRNAAAGGSTTEIEMTSPTAGLFTVKVLPANTISCTANTEYYFDIQVTIGDVVKTPVVETLFIKGDVTT